MFEGFSDQARAVIDTAQEQAHELGQHAVGTVHLLLGLLIEEANRALVRDTPGPSPLTAAGVVLEDVRVHVAARTDDPELAATRPGDKWRSADRERPHLPLTAKTRKALELSLRRGLQLGGHTPGSGRRQLITPAHVLLGTLDQSDATAREVLLAAGVDLARLTGAAEDLAAAAPIITTLPGPPDDPGPAPERMPDEDGTIYSVFGLPSHLSLSGPAARQVLTEWKQTGHLDDTKLIAAAETDAAQSPPTSDTDGHA